MLIQEKKNKRKLFQNNDSNIDHVIVNINTAEQTCNQFQTPFNFCKVLFENKSVYENRT